MAERPKPDDHEHLPLAPGSREEMPDVFLVCPGCGTRARGSAPHCVGCGESLLSPEAAGCLSCGSEEVQAGDAHCARCGAYLPEHVRPALNRPRRRPAALKAVGGAVAVALGLWVLPHLSAPVLNHAPSLAGVQVGDPTSKVEHRLGHPDRKPNEVFWNGPDGHAHRVALWQYGVAKDSDAHVADLTVTFLDGKVFQVGALDKSYRTSEGLKVGDPVNKASNLYGTAIEEDLVSGLLPIKYLRGGVVVKVVTMPGDNHVLAIGIESPKNLPMDPQASEPSSGGEAGSTDGGAMPLTPDTPSHPI